MDSARKRTAERTSQSHTIYERLHCSLVLFEKPRRYLPRSAFLQATDYARSNRILLGIDYEDRRIKISLHRCIKHAAGSRGNAGGSSAPSLKQNFSYVTSPFWGSGHGHFPSDEAATKLIYLALRNITKRWTNPPLTWRMAANQFAIQFGQRFNK